MYTHLAMDLDGTLLNSQKEIPPSTLEALLQAQRRGKRLILCTGRPTYGAMPTAQQLQMHQNGGILITYNGGMIIDCETLQVWSQHLVQPDIIPHFYQYARANALTLVSYKDDCIISENADDPYVRYVATINRMPSITVPSILDVLRFPVPKCLIVGDPSRIATLEQTIQCHIKGHANAFRSEPFLLELVPTGIDKGVALHELSQLINLSPSQLIACGDGFNDIPMLRYAGLGVAMANAQPTVRQAADLVTLSNDQEGLVPIISQYLA